MNRICLIFYCFVFFASYSFGQTKEEKISGIRQQFLKIQKFIDSNESKYIVEEQGNGHGSTYEIFSENERLYLIHQLSSLDNGHSHSYKYYFDHNNELVFVHSVVDLFNYTGGAHLYRELRIYLYEGEIIKTLEKKISHKDIQVVREFKANIDSQPNQEIKYPDLSSLSNADLLLSIWENMKKLKTPY